MIFVADESVDRQIIDYLRDRGYQIRSIAEMSPSIPDTVVLEIANTDRALLITADKDFGELVFRLNQAHQGVLLLRLEGSTANHKAELTFDFLNTHGKEIVQAFSVLSKYTARIRSRINK